MSTAKFCIKHKVTTLLAVIMIAIFGVVFTTQLQMSLLPDMEAPMAVVVCYYNGATPSDMEELVTRPLETAVMSVPGVDSVSSTSSDGVSQVQITYVEDTSSTPETDMTAVSRGRVTSSSMSLGVAPL